MPDALMLFAAGFGTRMGALTVDRPKPLLPVAGKPLIDHALDLVDAAGIETTVVNAHYKSAMIRDHLAARAVTVTEEPEILETGGGLRAALPLLGDRPVFTLNSDAIWQGPNPLDLLRETWDPTIMDALLLIVPRKNAIGFQRDGDFTMTANGQLARGPGDVYSGAQIVKTVGLSQIPERVFSLNRLWDQMLASGRLYGVIYPGLWCDVGTPQGLALAEEMIGHPDV